MVKEMDRGVISLITDFGTRDGYVGAMKGVILKINPQVRLVDITHEVSPQDIFEAGFILKNSYRYFPDGSIHLVVVDPGVGSKRRAILVEAGDHFFICPDNGVFTFIYELERIKKIVELTNKKYFLPHISNTFHGRDIFAPAAAYLSKGIPLEDLGEICNDVVRFDIPEPETERGIIKGVILHVDRFGNLISNIPEVLFRELVGKGMHEISIGGEVLGDIKGSYSEVKEEQALALFGSSGYLEISVRGQDAREKLKLNKGSEVKVVYE
ncbi:MAG: SAM-dependent chlorinase/fluorinase [Desulfobacteria bacterium]